MTLDQLAYMDKIVADLDARFPGTGSLTTDQICTYFGVSKPTAREWMLKHGKRVGDHRMPKVAIARFVAAENQ